MSRQMGQKAHRFDQAQYDKNIAALPETCYGVLNTDGSLILMQAGEKGYWPAVGYMLGGAIDTFDKLADHLNKRMDITRAQRKAMEAASIFGFDLPIGHPTAHELDAFIDELEMIDPALAAEAVAMRQTGAGLFRIRAAFQSAIEKAAPLRENVA